MKSVLISIKPKWCELIASGKKTIEIRKTRPKIETPFKVYIYQTLSRHGEHNDKGGKVIGEFICDEIEEFTADYRTDTEKIESIADLACVEMSEVMEYGYFSDFLLAWHISDRKIYDKPKALSAFSKPQATRFITQPKKIKRPPQSWYYVESLQEVEK